MYKSHNLKGIKLMTRLRSALSHLRERKFKKSFQDSIYPLCKVVTKLNLYFIFPFSTLRNLDGKLFDNTDSLLTIILLFGKVSLNTNQNTTILNGTMEFILSTRRFHKPHLSQFC